VAGLSLGLPELARELLLLFAQPRLRRLTIGLSYDLHCGCVSGVCRVFGLNHDRRRERWGCETYKLPDCVCLVPKPPYFRFDLRLLLLCD
jgi:hypothetical protein